MHFVAMLLQSQPDPELVKHWLTILFAVIPILILIGIAIVMVPFWFILKKAGLTPWLSLVCLIPSLGTLVLLYVLAFSEWRVAPALPTPWTPQPPYPPQA
jgi:uncharacterized BrkB/YihY/UPF0761 family membrane protein